MRPSKTFNIRGSNGFNPRICKRCDVFKYCSRLRKYVSIHASVKDATKANALATRAIMVSIHASVKDATVPPNSSVRIKPVSIHASVKDATKPIAQYTDDMLVSIHASVKDATRLDR